MKDYENMINRFENRIVDNGYYVLEEYEIFELVELGFPPEGLYCQFDYTVLLIAIKEEIKTLKVKDVYKNVEGFFNWMVHNMESFEEFEGGMALYKRFLKIEQYWDFHYENNKERIRRE